MTPLRRFAGWLLPAGTAAVIWLLWHLAAWMIERKRLAETGTEPAEAEAVRRVLLPLPHEIWQALVQNWETIGRATANTFLAASCGFAASVIIGGLIALLLASRANVRRSLYPWVLVLQMTPIVILAPIFAIWLGYGMLSIAAVTFVIGFFPIVANTTMGLVSTDRNLLDLFAVCNATRRQELVYLRIPYALPYFLTGLRIAGTLAPIGAITGDIFVGSSASGQAGIGFLTIVFRSKLDIPALYATAGVACLLGFVFVGCVNLLHWWALHRWHDSFVDGRT